jgi:hypothetical protein
MKGITGLTAPGTSSVQLGKKGTFAAGVLFSHRIKHLLYYGRVFGRKI